MARARHFSLTSNMNLKNMKTNLRNLTIVGVATVMVAGSAQATSITRAARVSTIENETATPKYTASFWRTKASSKSKSLVSVLPSSVVTRRYPVTLPAAILPANKLKITAVTVVTPPTRGANSVPDGGTTAAMLGTTLAGLALLKKKNAFRTQSLPA